MTAEISVLSFAQIAAKGGPFLMMQLFEKDGKLQVFAQSLLTKNVIKVGHSATLEATPEPNSETPPIGSNALPTDLPVLPGGETIS